MTVWWKNKRFVRWAKQRHYQIPSVVFLDRC